MDILGIEVEIEVVKSPEPVEMGGGCYGNYTLRITIAGEGHDVEGWRCGAWTRPGASTDPVTGCGLFQWGDNQSGRWWSEAGRDGESDGTPRPSWTQDGKLVICSNLSPSPSVESFPPEPFSSLSEEERERFVTILSREIEEAAPELEPPSASDVWYELSDEDRISPYVRVGNAFGAGVVVAWEDESGEFDYQPWPDPSDLPSEVKRAAIRVVEEAVSDWISRSDEG